MRRALGGALALLLTATSASAYVRSRTAKGVAVSWSTSCALVTPDSAGTPDMPNDMTFGVIMKSLTNWTNAVGDQAYLKLVYEDPKPLEAHLDGVNTIKFRTDRWCHPNDAQQKDVCYSSAAAGITTVFYVQDGSNHAGTILDADIELNDINFTFAVLPTTAPPDQARPFADLENTLTHELGHLQGLDHTCADSATPPQEVDDSGSPPPACGALASLPLAEQVKITTATMYNFAKPGEISKRSPKADDVAGIANAYPPASDPGSCKPVDLNAYKSGGCSIGGPARRSLAALAVLLGALVVLVARRRLR
ncbi:MAG TPA: hypothetical protein VF945_00720 [Polyangia bacterium]